MLYTTTLPWHFPTSQIQPTSLNHATSNTTSQIPILNTKTQTSTNTNPSSLLIKTTPIHKTHVTGQDKAVFYFGAKTFYLEFDDGRVDPYNIKERRGRFQGSIWLGHAGLKWLLELKGKLRNPQFNTQGFLQFFRDGYRTLEVSGMKNDRGTFIEISEFHRGSQQGGIRVSEGCGGVGWAYFEKELLRFFLNEKSPPMSCSVVGGQRQDGVSVNPGRKSDLGKGFVYGLLAVEIHRPKSRAQLLADAPRPTRGCDFIWKPRHKTLRITCSEGNLRQAKLAWIKDLKQARIVDFRAQEPRVNEVAQ
ncbi:hypothetical protein FCV25MIE_34279 [Fagus crenata]